MTNPIDPAAFQAFLAFQAQQQAAQTRAMPVAPQQFGGVPVTPAQPVQPPAPTVDVDLGDVITNATAPRGYGPALFKTSTDQAGTAFSFTVAGPTRARQMRDFTTKQPVLFQDGRPKPELLVPLDVTQSERHPEAKATLYAHGSLIAELARAMAAAGADEPTIRKGLEPGSTGTITYLGKQSKRGANGTQYTENAYQVTYSRPTQDVSGLPYDPPVAQVQPQPPAVVAPVQQPTPQPAAPVAPAGLAAPEGLTPEQAALFAKLVNAQQG